MTDKRVLLFYSYAHEDELLRKELESHLQSLVREGLIYPWHDREIQGGMQWAHEIVSHLQAARIILLLISPAFIASDYCYSIEMAEAVRREREDGARVIPIILRPCRWEGIPCLKELQALPKDAKPVTTWPDRDVVLDEITRQIATIAIELCNSSDEPDTSEDNITSEDQLQREESKNVEPRSSLTPVKDDATALPREKASRLSIPVHLKRLTPHKIRFSAIYGTRILSTIVTTLCIDVIANSVGLRTWGPDALFSAVKLHPLLSILLSGFFILAGVVAWIFAGAPKKPEGVGENVGSSTSVLSRRLVLSTILSMSSSIICFVLLAVIIFRPAWCPEALCPLPQPVLNPQGNSDGTLEVYFTTLQSSTFVIPANPSSYTLAKLPNQIGALRVDRKEQEPYRVVFGLHSLQRGSYGMFIDQISLVVDNTPPSPHPLNVWNKSAPLEYNSAPFRVTYTGEPTGSELNSTYVPLPGGQVQLTPGESQEIDLEVVSQVTVDLHFHIKVMYRVTNEDETHTLTLPGDFEVVFSDATNWHQYQLADGHLVPQ